MNETMIEERMPRGMGGQIAKWGFILFNGLMLLWLVTGLNSASEGMSELTSSAEQAGAAIGTGLGAFMIMIIWIFGVIILTPVLLLTRGKKVYKKVEA